MHTKTFVVKLFLARFLKENIVTLSTLFKTKLPKVPKYLYFIPNGKCAKVFRWRHRDFRSGKKCVSRHLNKNGGLGLENYCLQTNRQRATRGGMESQTEIRMYKQQ